MDSLSSDPELGRAPQHGGCADSGGSTTSGGADIGSNKATYIVVQDGKALEELRTTPALGKGLSDQPPYFAPQCLKAALASLKMGAALFQAHSVDPALTLSVGTAALRRVETIARDHADIEYRSEAWRIMNALRDAYKPYTFVVLSKADEAYWVARTALHDLTVCPPADIAAVASAAGDIHVVHSGGLSTEVLILRAGEVVREAVLDYGVHAASLVLHVRKQSAKESKQSSTLLKSELIKYWPRGEGKVLAVSGGGWRKLAKHICGKGRRTVDRGTALRILKFMREQDTRYFEVLGLGDRSPQCAANSDSLITLIEYMAAEEIIFLPGKMVGTLAAAALDRSSLNVLRAKPEERQPSCP